jgi:uncharacterized protein YjbJ (UPF0337 family)
MDKNRVKGAIDQVVGNAKRHIGDVIGDIRTQAEGAGQEFKGKLETGKGKLKDAAREARDNALASHQTGAESKREER